MLCSWHKVFFFRLIWPKVNYFCLATVLFHAISVLNCMTLRRCVGTQELRFSCPLLQTSFALGTGVQQESPTSCKDSAVGSLPSRKFYCLDFSKTEGHIQLVSLVQNSALRFCGWKHIPQSQLRSQDHKYVFSSKQ